MDAVNELARKALSGDKSAYNRLNVLIRKHPQVKELADKMEEEVTGQVAHKIAASKKKSGLALCPSTINGLYGKTSSRPWRKTK
ncbi:hypothetical protein QTO05_18420 [Vibrio fortis]|uniref:hypothetical protein n=1 Tax=Vibrio fortis TaxID=212667 RepID=UPI002F3E7938